MKKFLLAVGMICIVVASKAQFNSDPIKKRTLLSDKFIANQITNNASNSKASSLNINNDTLWYFLNKQRFKNLPGNQFFVSYPTHASYPNNGTLNAVEYGSSFLNGGNGNGQSITVNGAIILLSVDPGSPSPSLPVRVYLYNATSLGVPTTKVDSTTINVAGANGQFYIANFSNPQTVNGSFHMSCRSLGTPADTLVVWLTSGATATAGAAFLPSEKFGEGLSYIKGETTNPAQTTIIRSSNAFGLGTDFEAIIVPVVSHSLVADYTVSAPTSSALPSSYCTLQPIQFTNTTPSASVVYNRQFNFNRFISYWAPLGVQLNAADPINNWSFTNSMTTQTTTNALNTVSVAGNFTASLTLNYRPSPFSTTSQKVSISDTKSRSYSVVACTPTSVDEIFGFENLNIFPNPSVQGQIKLSGLRAGSTIFVLDMLGRLVASHTAHNDELLIDLSNNSTGQYIVKIINSEKIVKILKIVNQH